MVVVVSPFVYLRGIHSIGGHQKRISLPNVALVGEGDNAIGKPDLLDCSNG
jgi:hypothetical protein